MSNKLQDNICIYVPDEDIVVYAPIYIPVKKEGRNVWMTDTTVRRLEPYTKPHGRVSYMIEKKYGIPCVSRSFRVSSQLKNHRRIPFNPLLQVDGPGCWEKCEILVTFRDRMKKILKGEMLFDAEFRKFQSVFYNKKDEGVGIGGIIFSHPDDELILASQIGLLANEINSVGF